MEHGNEGTWMSVSHNWLGVSTPLKKPMGNMGKSSSHVPSQQPDPICYPGDMLDRDGHILTVDPNGSNIFPRAKPYP